MQKLTAIVLFVVTAVFAQAEIPAEKRAEIDRMLKLTGMERLMDQMMGRVMDGLRANMPQVPAEFWTRFAQKVSSAELIEKLVPLYDKYYTLDDLRAINAFYDTPAGQKILRTLPQLMQESVAVGQEWGRQLGLKAAEEVRAESQKKRAPAPARPGNI